MTDPREIKQKHEDDLSQIPGVTGVCTGNKFVGGKQTATKSIVVFVEKKKPNVADSERIPSYLGGVPTDVVEAAIAPLGWKRPLYVGDDIGRADRGIRGTLGLIYRLKGQTYGMTAAHVVLLGNTYSPGDITSPAGSTYYVDGTNTAVIGSVAGVAYPYDSEDAAAIKLLSSPDPVRPAFGWNCPANLIAGIVDTFQGVITSDVSLCGWPWHSEMVDNSPWPRGLTTVNVDDAVCKRGYASGHTSGRVYAVDLTAYIRYWGQQVKMTDMIAILGVGFYGFVLGGDSGAVVCKNDPLTATAMLIAGGGRWGMALPIGRCLRALHGDDVEPFLGGIA